jgi:uncharacterized protein YaiL (DUF2058 family)
MKQRQRKRAETLEEKHRIEREQELARQQQERDKLNEKLARIIEKSALVENVKVNIYSTLWSLFYNYSFVKKNNYNMCNHMGFISKFNLLLKR